MKNAQLKILNSCGAHNALHTRDAQHTTHNKLCTKHNTQGTIHHTQCQSTYTCPFTWCLQAARHLALTFRVGNYYLLCVVPLRSKQTQLLRAGERLGKKRKRARLQTLPHRLCFAKPMARFRATRLALLHAFMEFLYLTSQGKQCTFGPHDQMGMPWWSRRHQLSGLPTPPWHHGAHGPLSSHGAHLAIPRAGGDGSLFSATPSVCTGGSDALFPHGTLRRKLTTLVDCL